LIYDPSIRQSLSFGLSLFDSFAQELRMKLQIALAVILTLSCPIASAQVFDKPTPIPSPPLPISSQAELAPTFPPKINCENEALDTVEVARLPQLPSTIDLTVTPADLFERLRNGFSMPNINSDLVLYHQQWYMNRPDYLRRMVDRSSLYLYHIIEELNKRGMPTELALLPMVESAYNPMAYSRSRASGLWQFIPSTGKNYKLEQNWWIDERRDIVASTTAALDYLESIYEMHGDWHLALASYNWGEGAVGRAINKNKANGLPTDYLSLKMPVETKNYVPKLQALKNIFGSPRLLAEIGLQAVPNRPYFSTIANSSNIDIKVAARLAGMPIEDFVALNPAHNRPVIKSDTPLVIPTDKVNTFMTNLETHQDSEQPLSTWQPYTFQAGDKLEKIAPRFGMTVANLKAANGIQGRIKVTQGFTLLVAGRDNQGIANVVPDRPRLPSADPAVRPTSVLRTAAKPHSKHLVTKKSPQPLKASSRPLKANKQGKKYPKPN
jgi:membrane-bound lytic murein transglycosylase D